MSTPPSGEWTRVHPVSPLVRGWIALAAFAFILGRNWVEDFAGSDDGGAPARPPDGTTLLIAAAVLAGILLILAFLFFLSWWFTRYQVTGDHVRVHSGVIFRQQRQARLDRVQAIDIVQPLLARIFGLAELRFEVADAGESAVHLAYLKVDDARTLRALILGRASGALTSTADSATGDAGTAAAETADPGAETGPAPGVAEAPEQPILALTPGRVIAATLLSGTMMFLIAGVAAVIILTVVTGAPLSLTILLPLLFGAGGGMWTEFSTSFNFRASVSRDGIRIRYGLLDTRTQTVPPGRIQAVSVTQPPLWRLTGWYRISVNVAGYGIGSNNAGQARTKLLPAGTLSEVFDILALVLPEPGTDRPIDVFTAGITGRDNAAGFATTPRRARWIAPLAWRRNGFLLTDTALLIRSGALWRVLSVVPHERTQSMALEQGPLRRRFATSDLVLHSTPGPVRPRVRKMDDDAARRLFREQAARAREARRRDRTGSWNSPAPTTSTDPFSKEIPHEQR
ncbi:PH domain-containing protein [Arthrobacter sp. NPDC097144]|uniref:PH domain-containing protein n=1 Tax=Arthrobacter sp. NPDC097144 TaxID=3363946 RepID=UPI0038087FC7